MRLSNLADYAVVLMSAAARQCGLVALSAGMLAEQTGIPGPTAQKLVSSLARAGLLVASRGSGGGIRLARPAAAINVADIIEAVEGPIALTACVAEGRHDCSLEGSCKVQPHWGVVNGAVRGALAEISLASLSKPLPPAGGVWGGPVAATHPVNIPSPSPSHKREGRIEA
ncbi:MULTISPECIES: SUF system Fe-S cluster assembly regulator [unclassified Sphingopyxis]|uniref:SUF system Fe-S cluster assembly regulator n=1 Tax=unclassified Sphingopyxis TaxID=2614943 RepID=UPI0007362110|nr:MULTISPECIES: SUF system Fe-S cluster assembly regulator [unclassified Sphingopyxis]KTE40739.1 AsnC family transcriptional regulator [Sphingopyxis sp. HIX]